MKSLAMKHSFFKSTEADFKKNDSEITLDMLNKNILYLTYQMDNLFKKISKMSFKQETIDAGEYYQEHDGTSDNNSDN